MAVSKSIKTKPLAHPTQLQRIREHLLRLAPDVTAEDRKLCAREATVSQPTICAYLKGHVLNPDLGLKLITILKARIDVRELKLKSL